MSTAQFFKFILSVFFFSLLNILLSFTNISYAAVVLVYHHVNTNTPTSTTITPEQFAKHLDYLKNNEFNVVPLDTIVKSIKTKTTLPDKTMAITFDDGYSDIYHNAHPLLQSYGFPYTVFINPGVVPKKTGLFLDWNDLKAMSRDGVMIANHGLQHESLIKVPEGKDAKQWIDTKLAELQQAEKILKTQLGQSWHYFALPYGEYSQYALKQLHTLGYSVFTQQSGAVGIHTELVTVPRFPASQPYDKLATLKVKLHSLPFHIHKETQLATTVVLPNTQAHSDVLLEVDDFYPKMVQCFVSGRGKVDLIWRKPEQKYEHKKGTFRIPLQPALTPGRTRANCTAPSISKPGRYYWYSRPWFVPKEDGSWYSW